MKTIIGKTGTVIIFIITIIPVFLWLPTAVFLNPTSAFRSLGQVSALIGTVLFCLNFILAARWKVIEQLFFGLNREYIVHHLVGALGFILLVLHPVFLIISYIMISLESALNLVTPSSANIAVTLGGVALMMLIILLIITFYLRLEYDTWKKTHQLLGIPLFIASIHAYSVGSTLAQLPVLKAYMGVLFFVGIFAYVYRIIVRQSNMTKYRYIVEAVDRRQSVTHITMTPVEQHMKFTPGQFAFIEPHHVGVPNESHPFTMISAPGDTNLSFAVKSMGGFTETVKLLEKGTDVMVEGPYGRFGYRFVRNTKQIWVSGGIGITPFVSMLKSLPEDGKYSIVFIYSVRDEQDGGVLDSLIHEAGPNANVTLVKWVSSEKGRLSAENILQYVPDMQKRDIFLCGPPVMMSSIKQQLRASGISARHIHSEEFSLN